MRVSFHIGSGRGSHRGHRPHRHHHHHHHSGGGIVISGRGGKIFIGLILLMIGSFVLFFNFVTNNSSKYDNYVEVYGRVVDYNVGSDHDTWAEIVEYEVNGRKYEVSSKSYSNYPKDIGALMKVKYNPLAPSQAVVYKKSDNIMVYVIGGIFTAVGLGITVSGLFTRASKEEETE